jgi:putative copper resistance protein D
MGYSDRVIALAFVFLRALGLSGQALALGGAAIGLVVLLPWLRAEPGLAGAARRSLLLTAWGAGLAMAAQAGSLLLVLASVADAPGWSSGTVLATPLVHASVLRLACGLATLGAVAAVARAPAARGRRLALLVAALAFAASAAGTSHAAGRLDGRPILLGLDAVHQVATSIWVGGLVHLVVLALLRRAEPWPARALAAFSRLALVAVATLAVTGAALALAYVGDLDALVGTSYGGMLATKLVLFAGLGGLGALNSSVVRRLPPGRAVLPARLRRFVEVEAGLGVTLLFVAASLGAAPPAVDVVADRATPAEVLARFTPRWPHLTTPSLAQLEAVSDLDDPLAPRTAADTAWSEYNHNVAGLIVLAVGLLAALDRLAGIGWARHWPLAFLPLSVFLLFRSDPGSWPLSETQSFVEGLIDPEVLQHRVFALLPASLGIFEWLVRTGRLAAEPWARVFPLLVAAGGALLLAHAHPLVHVKEAYLMEITHLPLGALAVLAGWARWLDLRLPARAGRIAGRLWPPALIAIGLLLVFYREG